MDKLIIENVRCFGTRQEIPLAPLTVLVGENSSGKSTLLAATRIAWDIVVGRGAADFNEDPFRLGAFEQIAAFRGGRAARAKSFLIGQEVRRAGRASSEAVKVRVEGHFVQYASQPYLSCLCLEVNPKYRVKLEGTPETPPTVTVSTETDTWELPHESIELPVGPGSPVTLNLLRLDLERARYRPGRRGRRSVPDWILDDAITITSWLSPFRQPRPYAFAPVRSRPQRTYDPIRDEPDPEGQHVPMVLARLLAEPKKRGADLRQALVEFGDASGLFSEVAIHRLGKASEPFQIMVRSNGPRRNLIDVGYGISQILPILVEIATHPAKTTFLIQQPEVHLHPRAQAALATVFAQLIKERQCQLVVETHSDYFIDRLRMDIRDEQGLDRQDISLLYFDREDAGTTIYPIEIDRRGNIVNPPPNYRRFFLEEEHRFFGAS
jgi:predicted ATPase